MDYIQNTPEDVRDILRAVGASSVDDLFSDIPAEVRLRRPLDVPPALSESEIHDHLRALGSRNVPIDSMRSFLGGGFYNHYIPAAVEQIPLRGEFLTSYTPYQAEASQGTLQAIFEYQTMICEITGMDVSNASHYEGPTACAEAVAVALDSTDRKRVAFSAGVHPETRRVCETYFRHMGVEFSVAELSDGATDLDKLRAAAKGAAGLVVQNPNAFGCLEDLAAISALAREAGALSVAVVNPVSLGILESPGACGFDLAVGEGQPLGVEISFGGPTFGFMAARQDYLRRMPGRIVGQTVDADGKRAFVLTLQAREQHIRREKASSNICTNQALISLRGTIYLAGLGRNGLPRLANLCLQKAHALEEAVARIPGVKRVHTAPFFHEFAVSLPRPPAEVNAELLRRGFIGGAPVDSWGPGLRNAWLLCATERTTRADIVDFAKALAEILHKT